MIKILKFNSYLKNLNFTRKMSFQKKKLNNGLEIPVLGLGTYKVLKINNFQLSILKNLYFLIGRK